MRRWKRSQAMPRRATPRRRRWSARRASSSWICRIARGSPTTLQYVAGFAQPWPGALAAWRRRSASDFTAERTIAARAVVGSLVDPLAAGPLHRWDRTNAFRVALSGGSVGSVEDIEALAGENAFALLKPDGAWEILAAADAVLTATKTWRLSRLLRGLGGSEDSASVAAPAGSLIVKLDESVVPLANSLDADSARPPHGDLARPGSIMPIRAMSN